MNTPAAKRRRVDAANATLRKPFHSPLLRRQPDAVGGSAQGTSRTPEANTNKRPVEEVYSPSSPSAARQQPQATRGPPRDLRRARPASPLKPPVTPGAPRAAANRKTSGPDDPDARPADGNPFLALARAHRNAAAGRDAAVRDLDRRLETVRQAAEIEAASERSRPGEPVDQEMRDLVAKWMGASRMAAEELFETVRERVDNEGGMKAWREMQQRQLEFYRGFDQDSPAGSKPADEDHDAEYSQDVKDHLEDGGRCEESRSTADEDDEPEFTMAHMLRSLNIDFSLVGYDDKEDKWIN